MLGSLLGGAALGGISNMFSQAMDQVYRWNDNNWQSPLDAQIQLKNIDYDLSNKMLDKQIAYNKYILDYQKEMANSAYQRAVADMEKAGINPAALAGVNASSAQTPNAPGVSAGYHSAGGGVTPQSYGHSMLGSTLVNSAVNAAIAKNRNVADAMAAEIVDNARHEHRLEEMREQYAYNVARDANKYKNRNSLDEAKADYYDEMATRLRWNRLGIND